MKNFRTMDHVEARVCKRACARGLPSERLMLWKCGKIVEQLEASYTRTEHECIVRTGLIYFLSSYLIAKRAIVDF